MTCSDADPLLNAYFDGELDLTASLGVERHLAECRACAMLHQNLVRLREEIIDADLHYGQQVNVKRLRASVRRRVYGPFRWTDAWRRPWIPALAAAAILLAVVIPGRLAFRTENGDREVVDSHLRSLMSNHLIDVVSSDRHTVKPWFQGKLNFSPPVPDLTPNGFTLEGGRLDVIAAHPAAAIVYRRRNHVINLWVVPADQVNLKSPGESQLDGYNVVRWRSDAFSYSAVSDLNGAELRAFADLVRGSSGR